MTEREEKAVAFLRAKLSESEYFKTNPASMRYREEHSFRVAALGRQIARAEGLDEEKLVLGCLLHDISYCRRFRGRQDWINHGREAARIARPFLETLGLSGEDVEEICLGIAIHVDTGEAGEGAGSVLSRSIGDADNIDRFDVYRIYETLQGIGFREMPLAEKLSYAERTLGKLEEYLLLTFATPTATAMWRDRVGFYRAFYLRLLTQLQSGTWTMTAFAPSDKVNKTGEWLLGVSGRF